MVCALLAFASVWAWRQYMDSPPYIDRSVYPIRGIDISSHNGDINFQAVSSDDVAFVFIKASEGTDFRDPRFVTNYEGARNAGLKTGAYHYFRFDADGLAQARCLLRTIGDRELDLGVAIDVEEHGNVSGIDEQLIKARLQDMIDYLAMRGYRPTIYTNVDGYYKYLSPEFEGFPIWICSFYERPFEREFKYWQYSHSGHVKGVHGKVDLNVFAGSKQDWRQFIIDAHTRPQPLSKPSAKQGNKEEPITLID